MSSPTADPLLRRLPSPYALFAVVAIGLLGMVSAVRGLVDADYYWHVTNGRLIVESGRVPSVDPFSFTWAGQPWTAHEWLGEVLIHLAVSSLGAGLAAFVFGAVAAGGPLMVGAALKRIGLPTWPVIVAVSLAVLVLLPYATVRPQAISWLLLGELLAGLLLLRPGGWRVAWLAPLLFLAWANLHGLYVIGLGVLALYAAFTLAGRTPMAPRRGTVVTVLVACVLATMLTPAGPAGLLYPLRYLEPGDWGLRHIAEWQPPSVTDARNLGLALVIVVLGATRLRGTPAWLVAATLLGVAGALLAVRNAPLAAIVAVPGLAYGLAALRPGRTPRAARPSVARARRFMEAGVAILVLGAAAVVLPGVRGLSGDRVIPVRFPVAATAVLERVAPRTDVLTEYDWGGYLIHRLHDAGTRVFVDGRNDMYDERILDDYLRIRNAAEGWQELAQGYGVEAILLPPSAAVTDTAAAEGWCEIHRDAVAVLLLRSCPA
jgi:hypothetical protein